MNEIALYIVTWTQDGKPRVEVFTDPTEAGLERDCQFFNKGHRDTVLTEYGLDKNDVFPDLPYTLVSKDGKEAEGLFTTAQAAHEYREKNYPLTGRKKIPDFDVVRIVLE